MTQSLTQNIQNKNQQPRKGQTAQKGKPADVSMEVNQMLELSERILILKQIPPKCLQKSITNSLETNGKV